eukprot:GEMP01050818.1.p1 GENE.GEMP01050818.1~~GEMP01050818.1.p1  ORF type:complete len:189 (-),score=20.32 GEMP01050818.1:1069-1602(-)
MNAKSVISARWITATFIELYVFAVFYHCNLGLRELFWSHVWAASYFSLGVHAAKRVAWRKLVDGFPLSTYMISMLNQVVVLPLVMFAVLVFTPDITTYLESARSSTDVFSPHIFYSIIGSMVKDVWMERQQLTCFSCAFLLHHLCTILGCAICLDFANGFLKLVSLVEKYGGSVTGG